MFSESDGPRDLLIFFVLLLEFFLLLLSLSLQVFVSTATWITPSACCDHPGLAALAVVVEPVGSLAADGKFFSVKLSAILVALPPASLFLADCHPVIHPSIIMVFSTFSLIHLQIVCEIPVFIFLLFFSEPPHLLPSSSFPY